MNRSFPPSNRARATRRCDALAPGRARRLATSGVAGALVLGAASLLAGDAHAQGGEAAARALFAEGRALADRGAYEQACPKFEESLRLDAGIGTQFNLADCWEHIGRTASAWARFLTVAAAAKASGQSDRERVARQRAAALESKLARLVIQVTSPAAGIQIERDGLPVGSASWGTAVPVDPGEHELKATAPGKKPWAARITVPAARGSVVTTVPALEDEPPPPMAPPPYPQGSPYPPGAARTDLPPPGGAPNQPYPTGMPPAPNDPRGMAPSPVMAAGANGAADSSSTQKVVGLVVGGFGLAGIVAGTFFYLDYKDKYDKGTAICADPTMSTPEDCALRTRYADRVNTDQTGAYVGFGVGGAALVTGLVLVVTAPSSKPNQAVSMTPLLGRGVAGAALRAAW